MHNINLNPQPIRIPKEIPIGNHSAFKEDYQFFLEKRNRELISTELCLCYLPIIRQYNFLPRRVLRETFNQSVSHVYRQMETKEEENNGK